MNINSLLSFLILFSSASVFAFEEEIESKAYYGDPNNDLVYVIDLEAMKLHKAFQLSSGSKPYPIDHMNGEHTYISTRGTNSVSLINNFELSEELTELPLSHIPRSSAYNASKGLSLISGADVSLSTVIKTSNSRVKKVVGSGLAWEPGVNTDFGGTLATGHPAWYRGKKYFMLNRVERQIELYNNRGDLLSTLAIPSTAHHLLNAPVNIFGNKAQNIFFATLEGNPLAGIKPAILKFRVKQNQIIFKKMVELDCPECLVYQMGAHHADISPDGAFIYVGSTEGHLFIIDIVTLDIVKVINAGQGAGHTRFIADRNLAVVTNHLDTFMTFIDTETQEKIMDVTVASTCLEAGKKSQGHTTGVSPDNRYLYMAASCDGLFVRIDLDTLETTSLDLTHALSYQEILTLEGTAYPIQGAGFIWQ